MRKHSVLWFAAAAAILAATAVTLGRAAAGPAASMDWPVYRGDPKGNQYVPLAQIHAANVHRLQPAWDCARAMLLVGGIGIMNIMLASVMERTREIGVRRAIGAKKRDIIRQFLIETTIISLAGGVMGVLVGVGLSQLIGYLAGWSTIVTTTSIVLAFVVSVAIGLIFGLYPAVRAARLDPVKALHYE